MANSIIMLGGRRAGKSTILASIIYQLNQQSQNDICSFDEVNASDVEGLYVRTRELAGMAGKIAKKRAPLAEFLVDMGANSNSEVYTLRCSLPNAGDVDFYFHDVPGERMAPPRHSKFEKGVDDPSYQIKKAEFEELKQKVSNSDVFIIAIDTPFLMEATSIQNAIFNRVDEIKNLLIENIRYNDDISLDKKLIIFCPVKCEKWLHEGKIAEVNKKVRKCYKGLIDKCIHNSAIEMYLIPIETAGNLEFAALRDAYLLRKENEEPERCSYDETTNLIYLANGTIWQNKESYTLEEDTSEYHYIDGNPIPYAWYKTIKDAPFAPKNCEQVAYYLLRFLVKKEIDIRNEKRKNSSIWSRFWEICKFWQPSFAEKLNDFESMIQKLEQRKLIKENVDGICQIQ